MKDRKKYQRAYAKTLKGRLVRCYNHMSQRVKGTCKGYHRYKGLSILDKQAFYDWAINDKKYNELHNDWVLSNFELSKCPSIDRIDSSKGYDIDNIRFLTQSENSRLGSISRWSKHTAFNVKMNM